MTVVEAVVQEGQIVLKEPLALPDGTPVEVRVEMSGESALLEIANQKNIPALMLTAHAFTPDNLVKSIEEGVASYIPKEEITEIAEYLVDVLTAKKEGRNTWETWQEKLPTSYFERRWGAAWKDNDRDFWDTFKASLKSRKK